MNRSVVGTRKIHLETPISFVAKPFQARSEKLSPRLQLQVDNVLIVAVTWLLNHHKILPQLFDIFGVFSIESSSLLLVCIAGFAAKLLP